MGVDDSISVIVGFYGDPSWGEKAKCAEQSALQQTLPAREVIVYQGRSLHEARNGGAAEATGDWLIFLDADDTLDPGYLAAMYEEASTRGDTVLFQPATLGVYPDGREDLQSVVISPARNLLERNHMIIGTMISRRLFVEAGGFRDLPMYEDWDLWIRAWLLGASWIAVPLAVYRVGVNDTGRNSQEGQEAVYWRIRNQHEPVAKERGLL